MSLADELLADLEGGNEDEEELLDDDLLAAQTSADGDANIDDIEEITEEQADDKEGMYDRVTSIARLRDSTRFRDMIEKMEDGVANPRSKQVAGPVEADPEYQLVVEANNLASEIEHEINVIHKFVRDKYSKRFPELESLVPATLEYLAVVKELGNDIHKATQNKELLERILLPATVIVVSVTTTTTQGQLLTDKELEAVNDACDMATELQMAKVKIFQFVEQRMTFIAPNLSAIVGAGTAAMLMGQASGLSQLSKMPACNVLVLGAQKRTLAGFSSSAILPHTGFIFYNGIVQRLPPDLRRKAARLVAAKCTLAARVDAAHASLDGASGRKLADEIASKIEKMIEPAHVKQVKALPKPLDQASKKRGGRRVRKMKERMGMTDMRRKANRMTFGDIAEDIIQDHIGFSLGQMKSGGGAPGKLRAAQVDQKSRARMSKMLQKNVAKANQFGTATGGGMTSVRSKVSSFGGVASSAGGGVSGTASSVTFTPVQGLEIVNPHANEAAAKAAAADANAKYFTATAGFLKVQTPLPGARMDTS